MSDVRLDLGYDIDPYPPLADVLATRPELARRCTQHGWFENATGQARLRETVRMLTAPRVTVAALARAADLTPRTLYGFIEGRGLQPENAERLQRALALLAGEVVTEE